MKPLRSPLGRRLGRQLARRRDETGAVTVMVAMSMVAVLVAAALVLDFGIARLDRTQNKSVADSAVAAGMRGLDMGDARTHSFNGVCQALNFLKANKPALASLSWAPCTDPNRLATICKWDDPLTHASFTGSANGVTVEINSPYDLTSTSSTSWGEETLGTLAADRLTSQDSCNHLSVVVRQTRQPGLGSLATDSDMTTAVRSVGRVAETTLDDQPVALLLLERMDCNAVVVNGSNSFVRVLASGNVPGLIHSDSTGELCSGNSSILTGDHASGIIARSATNGPGLIRVRAVGTPKGVYAYDSATNVVAEGGVVGPGPLVSRSPVDARYMNAARGAIADYETQAATAGVGWNTRNCNAPKAQLESVTGKLWINCGTNAFNTAGLTLSASTIFFDAKSVSAPNLAMPNATRVYVRGDTSTNGSGISISGSSFSMGSGSSNATCPNTVTTPTLTRARLVIGAGSFSSNPSSTVRLCGTTMVLRGGVTGGCLPSVHGAAPSDTVTCNGRLSMNGATDWTAPNKVAGQATPADWLDFEDMAVWVEASGAHDMGGGAAMRLSGVFFLPNGEFKVHGGANQDVRNSQYIARRFRADGSSLLELQPNPYDVIGVPALTGFTLVR